MATVINTSDDLLKLLAENAEFYQAVRRLVLTDELIELPERFARFTADVHDFITRQVQINVFEVETFRGSTARYAVAALYDEITERLGFTFQGSLSRKQLRQLIGPPRHTDVSREDRMSFIRTDLVIIADDAAGNTHYIALQPSCTGDAREAARARRKAELLQRFTGYPAHAVVASLYKDQDIQAAIDSGEIHWYPLEPHDFTP